MIEMLDHPEPIPDRTSYLRRAFGEPRNFSIRGRTYRFVPIAAPEGFVAGFFGRQVMFASFRPRDLSPTSLEGWDRSLFILDVAADSQVAAMQDVYRVGSPRNVLQNFLKGLTSEDGFRDYEPHVQYIVEQQSYWRVIEKYAGRITRIEFTFIPPNALRSTEEVMEFIKEASAEANSSVIKHIRERGWQVEPKGRFAEGIGQCVA